MLFDSRHSARTLVSTWVAEESQRNLPGYELQTPNILLSVSLKNPGILAGVPFVEAVVERFDCKVEWHLKEGSPTTKDNQTVATITGATNDLVRCEQLTKTIIAKASSIATYAKRLKDRLSELPWKGELVSPFTNTPGFALVEENAMFAAGVPSSRNQLSYLIPLSHMTAAGGIVKAISAIKTMVGKTTPVTVECKTLEEAKAAANAGATCIRFEDLGPKDLETCSTSLKSLYSSLIIEASVNLDESNLKQFAIQSVDSLTSPKLFHGYPLLDVILNYEINNDPPSDETQKRKAATSPESVQTSADNGNAYVIDISGSSESTSKRAKLDTSHKSGTPSSAGKAKSTSKKSASNSNRAGSRDQAPTPQQNRDQRFDGSQRQRPTPDTRRMSSNFRHNYQSMLNSSSGSETTGLLSPRTGINRTLQQQTANSFLQQARVMALLPQRHQMGVQGSPRGPHQPGLIGSGPTQGQHNQQQHQQQVWSSIMGGPPRPYGVCRNCGSYNGPGMAFCNNCRAPLC